MTFKQSATQEKQNFKVFNCRTCKDDNRFRKNREMKISRTEMNNLQFQNIT